MTIQALAKDLEAEIRKRARKPARVPPPQAKSPSRSLACKAWGKKQREWDKAARVRSDWAKCGKVARPANPPKVPQLASIVVFAPGQVQETLLLAWRPKLRDFAKARYLNIARYPDHISIRVERSAVKAMQKILNTGYRIKVQGYKENRTILDAAYLGTAVWCGLGSTYFDGRGVRFMWFFEHTLHNLIGLEYHDELVIAGMAHASASRAMVNWALAKDPPARKRRLK